MKNKHEEKKESLFQKKGFYAALYSCVGIVLVLAVIIAYSAKNDTVESPVQPNNYAVQDSIPKEEMQTTLSQTTPSYLTPEDSDKEAAMKAATDDTSEEETVFFKPKTSEAPDASPAPTKQEAPKATNSGAEAETSASEAEDNAALAEDEEAQETIAIDMPVEAVAVTPDSELPYESAGVVPSGLDGSPITSSDYDVAAAAESPDVIDEVVTAPVFSIFGDDQEMTWPVSGDIVMDYSVDRTVYDKTLEQFRTNNSIAISAPAGTAVKAAAEGVISSITKTREDGVSVTIDHGNGWTSTYSQLGDNLLVREGDVLLGGQEFAAVGNPSIYSVLLGDHLGFAVTKNDAPADPKTVLAALE